MAKEIKQKIVLEGEKEYSAALKDANRNLKLLNSALKAETAELGKNATEQQKAEVKVKNLKKQIAEQEKIVKTYTAALEEVREKYSDNEDAIARWETKLNDARTSLANMRNSLEDVGSSMQGLEADAAATVTATKSVADALGTISGVGSTVSSAIENVFTGMLDVLRDACSEVWALISETAARADNYGDVAGYWNSNAQEIQRWANAVEGANKSFDTLQTGVSKLALGDHDQIRKLTGVSWVGDVDQWKYAMDVLSSISGMEYQQRIDTLAELFGDKRATQMIELVNDWGNIQRNFEEWNPDETGYGMTTEGLETMSDLYDQIGKINQEWSMLKQRVAEGLGMATLGLLVNVDGMMDGVADFLNAKDDDERDAAIKKIRENLESFFTQLGTVIREAVGILGDVGEDLQGSNDPVTKMLGNILVGIQQAFQWLLDNQAALKGIFIGIFSLWAISRAAALLGTLNQIVMTMKTLSAFKTLKGLANGAAGGAGAGSAASAAASGGGGLLSGIGALWSKIATGATTLAGYVGNSAGPYMDWFTNNTDVGRWMTGKETWTELQKAAAGYVESVKKNSETFTEDWANNPIVKFFQEGFETNGRNAMALWDSLFSGEAQQAGREADAEMAEKKNAIVKKVTNEILEEVEDELLDDDTGLVLSPADRQAMEDYWDAIREDNGEGTDAANAYLELWNRFNGSAEDLAVFNKITEMIDGLKEFGSLDVDLPSWWFSDGGPEGNSDGEGITHNDIAGFRGLPAQVQEAARKGTAQGVSGIKVYMDGTAVGHLVAGTVSQDIAHAIL